MSPWGAAMISLVGVIGLLLVGLAGRVERMSNPEHAIELLRERLSDQMSIGGHLVWPLLIRYDRVRAKSNRQRRAYRDLQRRYNEREAYCSRIIRAQMNRDRLASEGSDE